MADMNTQRRGRFLIQELEEENDNHNHVVPRKRVKHASILCDSKICHKTMDPVNDIDFSTFIKDKKSNDWIDFNVIWEKFTTKDCSLLETSIERIFNYTDVKSDNCVPHYTLNNYNESDKALSLNKFCQTTTTTCHTTMADNAINNFLTPTSRNDYLETLTKSSLKTTNTRDVKNLPENLLKLGSCIDYKSLEINFNRDKIVSPSFSPILNAAKINYDDWDNFNKGLVGKFLSSSPVREKHSLTANKKEERKNLFKAKNFLEKYHYNSKKTKNISPISEKKKKRIRIYSENFKELKENNFKVCLTETMTITTNDKDCSMTKKTNINIIEPSYSNISLELLADSKYSYCSCKKR